VNESSSNKALTKALSLLSKRSYSKAILEDKLKEKEFPEEDILEAIKKLESLGFVDDCKYAESLAREYGEFKRYGVHRVKLKLIEKKVPEEIIKNVLQTIDEKSMEKNAKELAHKYLKNKNLPREKLYNRALSFLIRRGYSYELSKKAVLEKIS